MTVFFNFEKEKGEFTITLTKRGKVPLRQSDSGATRGLILDKEEMRASIYVIKEMFPGKRLPIKKVDPDIFEIHVQKEDRNPIYHSEDKDWKDTESVAKWMFEEYCGKRSCESCRLANAATGKRCIAARVEQLYREGNA